MVEVCMCSPESRKLGEFDLIREVRKSLSGKVMIELKSNRSEVNQIFMKNNLSKLILITNGAYGIYAIPFSHMQEHWPIS